MTGHGEIRQHTEAATCAHCERVTYTPICMICGWPVACPDTADDLIRGWLEEDWG